MLDSILSFDFAVLDFIRENIVCGFLDAFLGFFTVMGNAGIIWIALSIGLMITKKYRSLGIILAIGLVVMLLTGNVLLKNLIARPRPFVLNTDIVLSISPPSGYSFPSGHTFSSAISATIIFLYSKRAGIFAIITAFLIAFSRIYFYVHYPTDIIGGIILGVLLGTLVFKLCSKKLLPDNKTDTAPE